MDPLWVLNIICFLDLLGVGLVVPLITYHFRILGFTNLTIGLISATYSAIQILSGPLIGSLSDTIGRKQLLFVTVLISAITYGILGLATSLLIILLTRICLGIVKHTQSLCRAAIADLVLPEGRAAALGRSSAFALLGIIIGPVVGGHSGFQSACILTGILFSINSCLALSLPKLDYKPIEGPPKGFFSAFSILVTIPWAKHWDNFCIQFLLEVCLTTFFAVQALLLQEEFGMTAKHLGYTISCFGAIGAFASFVMQPKIIKLYKTPQERLYHFFWLLTISFFLILALNSIELYAVVLIPVSICFALLRIASVEAVFQRGDKNYRGAFSTASNSVTSLGRMVTPILTGLICDHFGNRISLLLAILSALLATNIVRKFGRERIDNSSSNNSLKTKT